MSFGLKIPLHLCKTNGGVVIKGGVIVAFEGGPAGPEISMLTPILTLDGKIPTDHLNRESYVSVKITVKGEPASVPKISADGSITMLVS